MACLLRDRKIDAVVHFAAFASAGESVENPGKYFSNNLDGTRAILDAMVEANVRRLVFSSSCSVYGQPRELPVREDAPTAPESPYGESKLLGERMLFWYDRAHELRSVALRYFNAAGASLDGSIGDDVRPPTRLVPLALDVALEKRPCLNLYGTDYDTPDGTCVRDYVHVVDLARAHVLALDYLREGGKSDQVNLGSGQGHSNREVIDVVERVVGRSLPVVELARRPGDPARTYADNTKARIVLGWEPRHSDLTTIVQTAWQWRRANPEGYRE
jgi:UDP-glucose 4-epimerase